MAQPQIENVLQEVTDKFTSDVLEALRAHGHELIDEMFGEAPDDDAPARAPRAQKAPRAAKAASKGPKAKPAKKAAKSTSGRLARRTPEEIAAAVGKVVTALKKAPEGLRAEDIRAATGLETKEMPRVLKQGVADKAFKIIGGQKRSTTYGFKGGSASPKKASAKPKKAARKAAKASGKGKAPKAKKATKKAAPKAKKASLNGAAHAPAATA